MNPSTLKPSNCVEKIEGILSLTGFRLYYIFDAQRGSNENTSRLLRQYFPRDWFISTLSG